MKGSVPTGFVFVYPDRAGVRLCDLRYVDFDDFTTRWCWCNSERGFTSMCTLYMQLYFPAVHKDFYRNAQNSMCMQYFSADELTTGEVCLWKIFTGDSGEIQTNDLLLTTAYSWLPCLLGNHRVYSAIRKNFINLFKKNSIHYVVVRSRIILAHNMIALSTTLSHSFSSQLFNNQNQAWSYHKVHSAKFTLTRRSR